MCLITALRIVIKVVGIALTPLFAAAATITALATECTIVIER